MIDLKPFFAGIDDYVVLRLADEYVEFVKVVLPVGDVSWI